MNAVNVGLLTALLLLLTAVVLKWDRTRRGKTFLKKVPLFIWRAFEWFRWMRWVQRIIEDHPAITAVVILAIFILEKWVGKDGWIIRNGWISLKQEDAAIWTVNFLTCFTGVFYIWDEIMRRSAHKQGTPPGDLRIILGNDVARVAHPSELREVAALEHEAFRAFSLTSDEKRLSVVQKWHSRNKNTYWLMFGKEEKEPIGFTSLLVVDGELADAYSRGMLKERGFVPTHIGPGATTVALYLQAIFVKRDHILNSPGLAQRTFFKHFASYFRSSPLPERMAIYADAETMDGQKFLERLGFVRICEGADNRYIYVFTIPLQEAQRKIPGAEETEATLNG